MAKTWTDNEESLRPQFDEALDARHQGNTAAAITLCYKLLDKLTSLDKRLLVGVHNELGYIYSCREDYDNAAAHFRKSTEVSPLSETASLGLFHSLFREEHVQEALLEAVRFLSLRDSGEYRSMFTAEGALRGDLSPPARALANKARQLLDAHSRRS